MNSGVFWSALEAGCSAVFSLGAAFIVARLIGPSELGIGAAAVAVHVLLWVAVNSLFADAIVQRATLDETILSSAAWASTAVGCGAAVVMGGSGWLLAWMLGDIRLIPMALVLAVPFPFVGAGGALQGILTQRRRYRTLASRTILGQGAGMVIGIVLALNAVGAWAPVIQQAAVSGLSALVLIVLTGWRPRATCDGQAVRALLRIGLPLTASTLVQIGRYRVFALLIGGTAGPTALGQIHIAFRLADTVRDIMFTALWRLFLPILAEHQHHRDALAAQVDRLLSLSSWVTLPVCGSLVVSLVPLTGWILGTGWQDAGAAAVPLACLTGLLALMFPSGAALIAMGQARFTLIANLTALAVTVWLVLVIRPDTPGSAVMVWCAAQLLVCPYSLWVNGRALGLGPFRPMRMGLPALIAVTAGAGAAMPVHAGGALETMVLRNLLLSLIIGLAAVWHVRWPHGGSVRRMVALGHTPVKSCRECPGTDNEQP